MTIGTDRDVYIARVVIKGGEYPKDVMPTCIEDMSEYIDATIVAVYADRRGERIINRCPLKIEGNIITDSKGRRWRALGVTYGDPIDPSFVPWGDGAKMIAQAIR